jgi:hypothetical protein
MARIKIDNLRNTEELKKESMKGICGGGGIDGNTLFRDGLTIKGPDGKEINQKATWTFMDGGVTSMDDWEAPSA